MKKSNHSTFTKSSGVPEFDSSCHCATSQIGLITVLRPASAQLAKRTALQHYQNISDRRIYSSKLSICSRATHIAQCSVFLVFVMDALIPTVKRMTAALCFKDSDTLITLRYWYGIGGAKSPHSGGRQVRVMPPVHSAVCVCIQMTYLIWSLQLPKYTYRILALLIGKPSVEMRLKPRLPKPAVYFKTNTILKTRPQMLADYEANHFRHLMKRVS